MLKKWTAGFLGAALLTCGMAVTTAAAADTASAAVRTVIVNTQASTEAAPGYLELGLQVDGRTKMSAAAATLTYDASKLTLCGWDDKNTEVDLSAATSWEKLAAVPAKAPDNMSGKASAAYRSGTKGYLMLSAEALQPVTLTQAAPAATMTEPVAQVVTVRMKYTGDFAAAAGTIQYVTDAAGSPAGGVVMLSDGTATTTYTGGQRAVVSAGKTVSTAAAGDAEFVSIVFYDWDDTQLGSIAVQKGKDATEAVKKFAAEEAVAAKLTAHEGYTFENVWVPTENDAADAIYGHYRNSSNEAVEKETPTGAVFTAMDQSLSVRAAFNGTAVVNSGALDEQHTISYVSAERLDKQGNYALTFQIERGNKPAAVKPYVVAEQTAGSMVKTGTVYSGKDIDHAVVVVGASTTSVNVYTVDAYGKSVYALANNKSNTVTKNALPGDESGYVAEGTVAYINNCLATSAKTSAYNNDMFKVDLGLSTLSGSYTFWRTALANAFDAEHPYTLASIKTTLTNAGYLPAS